MPVMIAFLCLSSCDGLVNWMSFHPDTNTYISERDLPEYIRPVKIRTSDSLSIQGLYFSDKNDSVKSKIIVYFHGNAGNMYHRITEAAKLFELGYDVFVVSYRGYARSEGSPSEEGLYIDGRSALHFVTHDLGYKMSDVVIYGRSIGTTVAIDAAQDQDIAKLILITPLSSGSEYAKSKGLGGLLFLVGEPFPSIDKINNVKCPLLIIHGDADEVIPQGLGLDLYNKFSGVKKFVSIPRGGHNNLEYVYPDFYWRSIREFLYE
ncbi:alpha/beta hydrolase [bacterium]|nr:alpha/beta hydrolase [bacterium]